MASASLQAFSLFCDSLRKAREDAINLCFYLLSFGRDAGDPRGQANKLRAHQSGQFSHVIQRMLDRNQIPGAIGDAKPNLQCPRITLYKNTRTMRYKAQISNAGHAPRLIVYTYSSQTGRKKLTMRMFSIPLMLVALSISAASANAEEGKRTLKLQQAKPMLSHLDVGTSGPSHGDILAFEAQVTGENGLSGVMHGMLVTIDIADGADTQEDRGGQIYFDLGSGNSIVVAGKSVYVGDSREMSVNTPQVRAVIGGTGEYIGTSGQVTTTRNEDGSYEHIIELVR